MAVERIRRRRPVRQRIIEVGRKKVTKVRCRGLFVLPNLFTTASLFCAFIAIVQAMDSNFGLSALMILLSMLFDGMDGRVARLTHTQSEFGEQFDSIADMTAFGVAPALVMYKFSLFSLGGLGWAAAFIYCLCAGIRLARFNCNIGVVDKRFFQGLPSPAAAALIAGFVWLAVQNKLPAFLEPGLPWFAFVLTLYSGLTMVCNAPFYSGKAGLSLKNAPFMAIVIGSLGFEQSLDGDLHDLLPVRAKRLRLSALALYQRQAQSGAAGRIRARRRGSGPSRPDGSNKDRRQGPERLTRQE